MVATALLAAGCGAARTSDIAATQLGSSHTKLLNARSRHPQSPRCPANFGFPLCPLPLPGFPKAQQEIALAYRTIKIRPEPHFGMQTPAEPRPELPTHVLEIEYGVEHLGYPYTNPCEHIAIRVTIRGDTHATACVEEGTPVILAALWRGMGTTWQLTLSSNNTKPYTIPEVVKIIDGWPTTGARILPRHR